MLVGAAGTLAGIIYRRISEAGSRGIWSTVKIRLGSPLYFRMGCSRWRVASNDKTGRGN